MRSLALALVAGLLAPATAQAAESTPASPLLPPEVARNLHHTTTPPVRATAVDYPADLRALTSVLDNYTSADDDRQYLVHDATR
ncbi:hypothetical protein [Lentzea sp. NPDC059081]|uniref:hypothetical protein n=1 Tax=Lentzea sp. NPDC059081 TaxID=3346719 RepID=UPI0036C1343F